MVTIADTVGVQFATAAELVQRLIQMGVGEAQLQQALQYPGYVHEMKELLMAPPPKLPRKLEETKRAEFITKLFPAKFDGEGHTRAFKEFPLYQDEREWLTQNEQVLHLLRLLTRHQLLIVLERSGLDGRYALDAREVGDKLCLSSTQVNRIRGQARRLMRDEAIRLVEASRRAARFVPPSHI